MAVIIILALLGLGLQGNWPKVLRVAAAGMVYVAVLAAWSCRGAAHLLWWPFAVAGASSGLVSGLVRPAPTLGVVVVQTLGAAFLIGTAHWLAVRWAPRVRTWLAG